MIGLVNENELTIIIEDEFDKPLIHKIHSIIDGCVRHCHKIVFHTFEHICV